MPFSGAPVLLALTPRFCIAFALPLEWYRMRFGSAHGTCDRDNPGTGLPHVRLNPLILSIHSFVTTNKKDSHESMVPLGYQRDSWGNQVAGKGIGGTLRYQMYKYLES